MELVRKLLGLSVAVACSTAVNLVHAEVIEELYIYGVREERELEGATGLPLTPFETPQSVSIIDSETVQNFGLDEVNDLLRLATGVNVESAETDRTYYNTRGFDITSMHVDGVGMPFDGLVQGALDTAAYEKIEVIRGANGLITGIGNPSGTINYVRKRPTNEPMMRAELSVGSWDKERVELDASSPLSASGRWAARAVVVHENKESWLDHYENERNLFYGIIDGQLGKSATLAVGYTRQNNESDGVLWGALPLLYSDGTQGDFDVSTTTTMHWTYWNTYTDTAFVELDAALSNNWNLKSTVTHTDYDEPSELFYVYFSGAGLDPQDGTGLVGWPGKYDGVSETLQWDTTLSGDFRAWGQEHQLSFGLTLADKDVRSLDAAPLSGFDAMPSFPGWTGYEVERPNFADPVVAAESDITLNRLYAATRLSVTDTVKVILGANGVEFKREGFSWGVSTDTDEHVNSPYVGLTWAVLPNVNTYASYSDIYQPQYEISTDFEPLGAAKGESYEAGVKATWFDGNLLTSFAVFRAEQTNLAEFATYSDGDNIDDDNTSDDFDWALYRGISARSQGFELEAAGTLFDSLLLSAGYTQLSMEDPNGDDARTFIPRKTLKATASWTPAIEGLELGGYLRWQSAIENGAKQGAYAVFGAHASYNITDSVELGINVDNITDEKYLSSLQWEQAFYGEPRSYTARVTYSY